MNCCERARQRIADQDRNAVGSLNRQQNFRSAANKRIAVLIVAENAGLWFCFLRIVNHAHVRAVNLPTTDRKSTRLNSSHGYISYAVFCLKKHKQAVMQS